MEHCSLSLPIALLSVEILRWDSPHLRHLTIEGCYYYEPINRFIGLNVGGRRGSFLFCLAIITGGVFKAVTQLMNVFNSLLSSCGLPFSSKY